GCARGSRNPIRDPGRATSCCVRPPPSAHHGGYRVGPSLEELAKDGINVFSVVDLSHRHGDSWRRNGPVSAPKAAGRLRSELERFIHAPADLEISVVLAERQNAHFQ